MIKEAHDLTSFILTSYLYSLVSRTRIDHKCLICLYNCINLHMLACGDVFDQWPCDRSINFNDYWSFCIAFIVNCSSVTLYSELHRELKRKCKISFVCFEFSCILYRIEPVWIGAHPCDKKALFPTNATFW